MVSFNNFRKIITVIVFNFNVRGNFYFEIKLNTQQSIVKIFVIKSLSEHAVFLKCAGLPDPSGKILVGPAISNFVPDQRTGN